LSLALLAHGHLSPLAAVLGSASVSARRRRCFLFCGRRIPLLRTAL